MGLEALIQLAWILWIILFATLLVTTLRVAGDPRFGPDGGRGIGFVYLPVLYAIVLGAAGLLHHFAESRSRAGLLGLVVVLGYFALMLVLQPATMAFRRWRLGRGDTRAGDFKDPVLRSLAEAIGAGDGAALVRRLAGKPAPPGRDRAGYDLLGYALVASQNHEGSLECVRALLDAGSDPDATRMPDGRAPLHHMITDTTPGGREAVFLLLEHGADPNMVDPLTGDTPIRGAGDSPELVRALVEGGADMDRVQANGVTALVDHVAANHWESARYLVEQGARLDVVNEDGLSLDYYLESWKDSVFGEHPEGWDRLRAAIAARHDGTTARDGRGSRSTNGE